MKSYPTIPHARDVSRSGSWYVFDKLDGSLIRVEWIPKSGFSKFGRKNGLLDDSNPFLPESKDLILAYQKLLDEKFRELKWKHVMMFFEFLGEHSFAGTHQKEPHEVVLVDIAADKKGLIDPKIFVTEFVQSGPAPTAKLLRRLIGGDSEVFDTMCAIEDGMLEGMTFEGAVFKRQERNKRVMFKHKSWAWLDKLKKKCDGDEKLFEQLR
jgi:hypothetical protein